MGLVLLDSSVLIALLNPKDLHHEEALNSNSALKQFMISSISITELMPRAIRDGISDSIWRALLGITRKVVDVDLEVARAAATLRAHKGMKTPDAIISATAALHGAELWTFDAQLAKATPGALLLS